MKRAPPSGPTSLSRAGHEQHSLLLQLFAFPAESNYSGARLDASLAEAVARPGGLGDSLLSSLRTGSPPHATAAPAPSASTAGASMFSAAEHSTASGSASASLPEQFSTPHAVEPKPCSCESACSCTCMQHPDPARWLVAVDAAKACSSRPPDLSKGNIDMVVSALIHDFSVIGLIFGLLSLTGRSLTPMVARHLHQVILKLDSAFAAVGLSSNAWCRLCEAIDSRVMVLGVWGHDVQALSYYKIFGYPTGLGALVVRNSVLPLLNRKKYFGGGTVAVSVANDDIFEWVLLLYCQYS